jgi:hypothetical protein
MKKNATTTILNWALMLGAVLVIVAAVRYYNKSSEVRNYQGLITQFNGLQQTEAVLKGLVADSIEYAKTHPGINPVLDPILGKQPAASPTKAK